MTTTSIEKTSVREGASGGGGYLRFQQKAAPYLFLAPFFLLFALFGVYPILKSVTLAFYATSGPKDMVFNGGANFTFLFQDRDFYIAVGNTVTYALFSVFLQLPIALGLAILLSQTWLKGREFWRLAFFSPNLLGQVFVGVLFAVLYQPQFGLVNKTLHSLTNGLVPLDTKWLGDPNLVMPALVLTSIWMYAGFNMIYFLAALQAVDKDLYEAASVDGASAWQQFLNVTVPGIRPVTTFVLVTATLGSLQLFELPYILLNNGAGPDQRGLTIIMYLYNKGFVVGDLGYASAVGWTLALGMLIISLIQVRITGAGKEGQQ
ncbi:MAG: sugar ABC transporter permease [Capsulimonadales bacterium]|nr:sugar ABC transporter permease [Capsulimonadales bacterium]